MLVASIPDKFNIPWADAAGGSFIVAIPEASQIGITNGAASLTDGFPPLNFDPVAAGGVPPRGVDFNGILKQITQWAQWEAAGGPIRYDAVFSAAIGGYPAGAVLSSTALGAMWLNLVDNNTSDPDAAGANWYELTNGRLIDVQVFDVAGTFTYTPATGVNLIEVEGCGPGGAGGGTEATGVGQVAIGGGGGAGAYGITRISGSVNFSGQTVTIGGAGVAVSGANGGNGLAASSFGAFLVLPPGSGGTVGVAANPAFANAAANGAAIASVTGGTPIKLLGGDGGGIGFGFTTANVVSGAGASCPTMGTGGQATGPAPGATGTGFGAGGSGAASLPSTAARAGGGARGGKIIIRGYSG